MKYQKSHEWPRHIKITYQKIQKKNSSDRENTGVTDDNNVRNEIPEEEQEPQEYVRLGDINIVIEKNANTRELEQKKEPDKNGQMNKNSL